MTNTTQGTPSSAPAAKQDGNLSSGQHMKQRRTRDRKAYVLVHRKPSPIADRIECLWIAGLTIEEISQVAGCSRNYVVYVSRSRGLPTRVLSGRQGRKANMWPYIVRWAMAGYDERQIKDGLGYHRGRAEFMGT